MNAASERSNSPVRLWARRAFGWGGALFLVAALATQWDDVRAQVTLSVPRLVGALVLIVVWTKPANRRKRFLRLLVMTLSVLLSAFVLDLALRFFRPAPYVPEGEIHQYQGS